MTSKRRVTVWGGLALLLAGAALWMWHGRPAPVPARVIATAGPAPVPSSEVAVRAAPASVPLPAHGPNDIRICGDVWVAPDAEGQPDAAALNRAIGLTPARDALVASLRASGGERGEASAQIMTLATAMLLSPPQGEALDEAREALTRLATTTGDPQVYAWAWRACQGVPPDAPGGCGALSAARWAQLDPQNATPWLQVLAAADAHHDAAAAEEALYRISTSARDETGVFRLARLIPERDDAQADRPMVDNMLLSSVTGFDAATAIPAYQTLVKMCRPPATQDANRVQVCGRVAELLVANTDNLLALSIGIRIGERLGWPAERTDALLGERDAFMLSESRNLNAWAASPAQAFECEPLRQFNRLLRENARLGEVGRLRAWVQASGKEAAEFARLHRQTLADHAAAAASEAAASAPP